MSSLSAENAAVMSAYRWHLGSHDLVKEEVPVPVPGEGEALIKVEATGLCGTDLHVLNGAFPFRSSAFTLGHEVCGILHALGPSSSGHDLQVGKRYAAYPVNPCLKTSCPDCHGPSPTHSCRDRDTLGLGRDGGFTSYVCVPARVLVPVPDGVSAEVAAVCTDAVLTPFHALRTRGEVGPGKKVLIIGVGGLGSNAVQIARHVLGAERVFATYVKAESRDLAVKLGAHETIEAHKVIEYLQANNIDIDVAVDFVGIESSFTTAFHAVRPGGRVVSVGLGSPAVQLPLQLSVVFEKEIRGSFWGRQDELAEVLQLVADGKITPQVQVEEMNQLEDFVTKLRSSQLKGRVAFKP